MPVFHTSTSDDFLSCSNFNFRLQIWFPPSKKERKKERKNLPTLTGRKLLLLRGTGRRTHEFIIKECRKEWTGDLNEQTFSYWWHWKFLIARVLLFFGKEIVGKQKYLTDRGCQFLSDLYSNHMYLIRYTGSHVKQWSDSLRAMWRWLYEVT